MYIRHRASISLYRTYSLQLTRKPAHILREQYLHRLSHQLLSLHLRAHLLEVLARSVRLQRGLVFVPTQKQSISFTRQSTISKFIFFRYTSVSEERKEVFMRETYVSSITITGASPFTSRLIW